VKRKLRKSKVRKSKLRKRKFRKRKQPGARKNKNRSLRPSPRKGHRGNRREPSKKKSKRGPALRYRRRGRLTEEAAAALRRMRQGFSLAQATRLAHIKPKSFLRQVGSDVYRSGPGKPWKVTKTDRLTTLIKVLTPQGYVTVPAHGLRERTMAGRHQLAVRSVRAGEDGAELRLLAFEGQTVGGHVLVTDPELILKLEEAGKLDFDNLYSSFEVGS